MLNVERPDQLVSARFKHLFWWWTFPLIIGTDMATNVDEPYLCNSRCHVQNKRLSHLKIHNASYVDQDHEMYSNIISIGISAQVTRHKHMQWVYHVHCTSLTTFISCSLHAVLALDMLMLPWFLRPSHLCIVLNLLKADPPILRLSCWVEIK